MISRATTKYSMVVSMGSRAKAASKQGRDRESRAMPKGSAVVSRDSRVMARVSRVMTMITMRNAV